MRTPGGEAGAVLTACNFGPCLPSEGTNEVPVNDRGPLAARNAFFFQVRGLAWRSKS